MMKHGELVRLCPACRGEAVVRQNTGRHDRWQGLFLRSEECRHRWVVRAGMVWEDVCHCEKCRKLVVDARVRAGGRRGGLKSGRNKRARGVKARPGPVSSKEWKQDRQVEAGRWNSLESVKREVGL